MSDNLAVLATITTLAVLILLVLGVLAGPEGRLRRPAPAPEPVDSVSKRVRQRLIVTLKSGESFAGVVLEADERAWVLVSAVVVAGADDRTDLPVDGEIILMTADIAYAQKP